MLLITVLVCSLAVIVVTVILVVHKRRRSSAARVGILKPKPHGPSRIVMAGVFLSDMGGSAPPQPEAQANLDDAVDIEEVQLVVAPAQSQPREQQQRVLYLGGVAVPSVAALHEASTSVHPTTPKKKLLVRRKVRKQPRSAGGRGIDVRVLPIREVQVDLTDLNSETM